MSTYLLCLIVCDFEYTEATTTKGVQVSWMSRSAIRFHIINKNGCINMRYTCIYDNPLIHYFDITCIYEFQTTWCYLINLGDVRQRA